MFNRHLINVDLPAELFDRLRKAVARSNRSSEAALVESPALIFGTPHADPSSLAEGLETLPDAQLWALVYRRLA